MEIILLNTTFKYHKSNTHLFATDLTNVQIFVHNISKPNGKIPLLFVDGLKLNSRLTYEMSNSTLCRLEKGLKERTHRKLLFSKGAGKLGVPLNRSGWLGCVWNEIALAGLIAALISVSSAEPDSCCVCVHSPPRHSHANSIIFHSFTIFRASLLLTAPPPS